MTIHDVALHLNVDWVLVKAIQNRDLSHGFAKPTLKHPRPIGIDEISVAKGHRYLAEVVNLERVAVVLVGHGKRSEALKPFWKRFRSRKAVIEEVAMEMSPFYLGAVSTLPPKDKIVCDCFQVVKPFSEKHSDPRRALHRAAIDKMRKNARKVARWLLLEKPESLDISKIEKPRLGEAVALNKPMATA